MRLPQFLCSHLFRILAYARGPRSRSYLGILDPCNGQESNCVQCQDLFSAENEKNCVVHHGSGASVDGGRSDSDS